MPGELTLLSEIGHVQERLSMYTGSTTLELLNAYICDKNKFSLKTLNINQALLQIFKEILTNAYDHSCEKKNKVTSIKINISKDGTVSIQNNGKGISDKKMSNGKSQVENAFGSLRCSSHYNNNNSTNNDENHALGQNGLGCKLTNICSIFFKVRTAHGTKVVTIEWKNNMSEYKIEKETIEKEEAINIETQVKFKPDFKFFSEKANQKIINWSDDMISYMYTLVVEMSSSLGNRGVNVYWNNNLIEINSLRKLADAHVTEIDNVIFNETKNYTYMIAPSESFKQRSWVNSMQTPDGGIHVKTISDQITTGIVKICQKKTKSVIKKGDILNNLYILVWVNIKNPVFDSQNKTKLKSLGDIEIKVKDTYIKQIAENVGQQIIDISNFKAQKTLNKGNNTKSTTSLRIEKYHGAKKAGTREGSKCKLFLVEGDSALTFWISGAAVTGTEYSGSFALKGKLLNFREATIKQKEQNKEIKNICRIMGLKYGEKYNNVNDLRYGGVVLLTDADDDGVHIAGLLINYIHCNWPELLLIEDFISYYRTPIVKLSKKNEQLSFYTQSDYQEWLNENENRKHLYKIKYYKGLGTSTAKEAKESFQEKNKSLVALNSEDKDELDKDIKLAFSKTQADARKQWLTKIPDENIEITTVNDKNKATIHDFINKSLIHYSNSSNIRCIPNVLDGLKPSQRKVLYACLKRKLTDEIKVAQLAGYVSEHTAYHHGEQSLMGAIINMAQDYVGSNNINLLFPSGQFGTRLLNGNDAASPRYISTYVEKITELIFNPNDNFQLEHNVDDGKKIEYNYYIPTIPVILVNGSTGIGTGWSTNIPPHNIDDIVLNIKRLLKSKPCEEMKPYYENFKGNIVMDHNKNKITIYGCWERISNNTILITELPIGISINAYITYLNKLCDEKKVKNYEVEPSEKVIRIKVIFDLTKTELDEMIQNGNETESTSGSSTLNQHDFEKIMKLKTTVSLNNMTCFNSKNIIQHYKSAKEILEEFYIVRYNAYVKRKEYVLDILKEKILVNTNKKRFIEEVRNKIIPLLNPDVTEEMNIKVLNERNYHQINGKYDYLLMMPLRILTKNKMDELEKSIQALKQEYSELESMTIEQIWVKELDIIIEMNMSMRKSREDAYNEDYQMIIQREKGKDKKRKSKK